MEELIRLHKEMEEIRERMKSILDELETNLRQSENTPKERRTNMEMKVWMGEGVVQGYRERLDLPLPENKDLGAYIAYSFWCANPHETVHAEITAAGNSWNPDGTTTEIIHLPKLNVNTPWAMETLAGNEEMKNALFIGAWLNQ